MAIHCNIFQHQNENYEVVSKINASTFMDRNGQVNQKLLGMYVHEFKANRVIQHGNKFLVLKEIEDAIIEQLDN